MAPRSVPALSLVLFGVLAVGCDATGFKSKVKSPDGAMAKPVAGQTTTTGAGLTPLDASAAQKPTVFTPGLSVSDRIAQACGIAPRAAKSASAASFDYDSAALGDEDRQMLAEVAKCLTEGALRGRSVALIGRADARGEPEYNMTLGESRANGVGRYLVDLGVGKDRLKATSRGELDATGSDEAGWANDRRVDIELL
jgi:peptidoglycan-associated lipoprotein